MAVARSRNSYQQVTQQEEDAEELKNKNRTKKAEWISTKIHAFLWVVAAGALLYFLDFFNVIFQDERVNRIYFNIGLCCFGINCCITFYLAIWLPRIQKIHLEWSVYCPRMIPTATAFGVISAFGFVLGLWPIYGVLTPGILFVLFVGALMSAHFLPAI